MTVYLDFKPFLFFVFYERDVLKFWFHNLSVCNLVENKNTKITTSFSLTYDK